MVEFEETSCRLERALLTLDRMAVKKILTESGVGGSVFDFADRVIVPAMERMGEAWDKGTVALSQYYMSARILEESLYTILPVKTSQQRTHPKMAIATLNDYHVLGKRIVASALQVNGFKLKDYGRKEVDELVKSVREDNIHVLLISVLMLPSALMVKELRKKLDETVWNIQLIVGGAPFRLDEQLWREVGADAMGKTASEAIEIVSSLTEESK